MSAATICDTLFNGLLIGTTGYAMFSLCPVKHPYAFAASAVGFCHGCAGIYTRYFDKNCGSEGKCMNDVKKITTSCMEIVTIPLINIDLYLNSQQTSALALGHGVFIVPLVFDLSYKMYYGQEEDDATSILRDLTMLGNIVSLVFFAVNEKNLPAGIMGLSAFFAYSGSMVMEYLLPGTEENSSIAGYTLLFGALPAAIAVGSNEAAN